MGWPVTESQEIAENRGKSREIAENRGKSHRKNRHKNNSVLLSNKEYIYLHECF